MKFIIKYTSHSTLHIGYKEKYIEETVNKNVLVNKWITTYIQRTISRK